ncbi:MAG: CHASE domain-containing protein, partial [Gammaproteobacteria bacterium]|nr:CHASE domain-containing protein [Gammaproteobacteria bacterium]
MRRPTLKLKLVIAGIAIAVLVAAGSTFFELEQRRSRFLAESASVVAELGRLVEGGEAVLTALRGVNQESGEIGTAPFYELSHEVLSRYDYIGAIARFSRISEIERPKFELMMRQQGFISYTVHANRITERSAGPDQYRDANTNSGYFMPLRLVEPMTPENSRLLGVDAYSTPSWVGTIQEAVLSG